MLALGPRESRDSRVRRPFVLLCCSALTTLQPVTLTASGPSNDSRARIINSDGSVDLVIGEGVRQISFTGEPDDQSWVVPRALPKIAVYDWCESVYGASGPYDYRERRKGIWIIELATIVVSPEIRTAGYASIAPTPRIVQFKVEGRANDGVAVLSELQAVAIRPKVFEGFSYEYVGPYSENDGFTGDRITLDWLTQDGLAGIILLRGAKPRNRTILSVSNNGEHGQYIGIDEALTDKMMPSKFAKGISLPTIIYGTRILSQPPPPTTTVVVNRTVQIDAGSIVRWPSDPLSPHANPTPAPPAYYTRSSKGGGGFERGEARLTLNRQLTRMLNAQHLSFIQAIDFLKQDYSAKGYSVVED